MPEPTDKPDEPTTPPTRPAQLRFYTPQQGWVDIDPDVPLSQQPAASSWLGAQSSQGPTTYRTTFMETQTFPTQPINVQANQNLPNGAADPSNLGQSPPPPQMFQPPVLSLYPQFGASTPANSQPTSPVSPRVHFIIGSSTSESSPDSPIAPVPLYRFLPPFRMVDTSPSSPESLIPVCPTLRLPLPPSYQFQVSTSVMMPTAPGSPGYSSPQTTGPQEGNQLQTSVTENSPSAESPAVAQSISPFSPKIQVHLEGSTTSPLVGPRTPSDPPGSSQDSTSYRLVIDLDYRSSPDTSPNMGRNSISQSQAGPTGTLPELPAPPQPDPDKKEDSNVSNSL